MSDITIKVENISKRYRIGLKEELYDTFLGALTSWIIYPISNFKRVQKLSKFNKDSDAEDIIWALRDVSFEVRTGKVLGIIGRNGAGKSTLLKILSRVTDPTYGFAKVHGKVCSLLEVGIGFHPELTGRENIYLNGTILGMGKSEIDRKFDEIVDFAEIEKFIDTPVKRYSSGMYVRLAFAVAAHLESEILLVDEVLAVGDFAFQKKCLGKMRHISGTGRTVLFVSHNMAAIKSLCNSCLLLESGAITYHGKPVDCVNRYLDSSDSINETERDLQYIKRSDALGGWMRFTKVRLRSSSNKAIVMLKDPLVFEMEFSVIEPLADFVLGFSIYSEDQVQILQCLSTSDGSPPIRHLGPGNYKITCTIPENLLAPGRYTLELGARNDKRQQDEVPYALQFEIIDTQIYESTWMAPVRGYFRMPSQWSSPEWMKT